MKDISETLEYKGQKYPLVFNLNVLEEIQGEYGAFSSWLDKIAGEGKGEPDIKAIKFAYFQMINEGLDIENEDLLLSDKPTRKPVTTKFIGRMFTEIGLENVVAKLEKLAAESNQGGQDSKNA